MSVDPNSVVRISEGRGNKGRVQNKTISWNVLQRMFQEPIRTGETLDEYSALSQDDRFELKSNKGYWMRCFMAEGHRKRGNAEPSVVVTMDFDYIDPDFYKQIINGELDFPYEYFVHSSRNHREEEPRIRMVLIADEPISEDEYPIASRIIAHRLDETMENVDHVSFRPAQMMFKPTVSKDQDYVFKHIKGELLPWRELIEEYALVHGDPADYDNLPRCPGEEKLRKTSDKAEVPTEKVGIVGEFCRTYDIFDAIAEFDLPYTEVSDNTGKPRFTYDLGSTSNGAEVQDDGLFLYSHHGTDPAGDQLVNAFDLVRLHKFGDKDSKFDPEGKAVTDRPSFKAMCDLAEEDPKFMATRVSEKYDVEAMFDGLDDFEQEAISEADEEAEILALVGSVDDAPKSDDQAAKQGDIVLDARAHPQVVGQRKRRAKPSSDWIAELLELTKFGDVKPTAANVMQILQNDLRFRDTIAFNEFSNSYVLIRDLKTGFEHGPSVIPCTNRLTGDGWTDFMDGPLHFVLTSPNGNGKKGWGLATVAENALEHAKKQAALKNKFHPIREVLESLETLPGARAESLFVDYLGCPDTPYYRETARLWMIAAIDRVYNPGCKFDNVPVLWGAQGVRKSTFIETLALGWFGELTADFKDDKKLMEQMQGKWVMELAELVSMAFSEVEHVKQFITQTTTKVRMSYDRHAQEFPRQCVFMGSTNQPDFLKDDTGNRRFWPIKVYCREIDINKLTKMVGHLWADALVEHKKMRAAQPVGNLDLRLSAEALSYAVETQEVALRPSAAQLLADDLAPILNSPPEDDEAFGSKDLGEAPSRRRRESITMSAIRKKLDDPKVHHNTLSQALNICGWGKTGARRRVGTGNPQSVYEPSREVLEEWRREDENRDLQDLV